MRTNFARYCIRSLEAKIIQAVKSDDDPCDQDRISSLPDDLLCHILSFLPTHYAVRTSLLSKRWRPVWTRVQILHFDDWQCLSSSTKVSIVDEVLYRNSMPIQKLHLHCTPVSDISQISTWISAAVERKIRELDILASMPLPADLIQILYACETLEVLKIGSRFSFPSPTSAGFPRLKVLHLRFWCPDSVSMQIVFRNCPVLEELVIEGYRGFQQSLEIFVPTLKRLRIRLSDAWVATVGEFNVTAPALECLDIFDDKFSRYQIGELPCLNKAKINIGSSNFSQADRAMQLVSAVANTKSLSLSASTMCILNSARGANLPMFPNLRHLELHVLHGFGWNLVVEFLKSSPKLEIFVVRKEPKICWHCFDAQGWTPQQFAPPSCLVLNVKVIEIMGFKRRQDELELLKYLLKHAQVLEKMIIDSMKLDPEEALSKF